MACQNFGLLECRQPKDPELSIVVIWHFRRCLDRGVLAIRNTTRRISAGSAPTGRPASSNMPSYIFSSDTKAVPSPIHRHRELPRRRRFARFGCQTRYFSHDQWTHA